MTSPFLQSLTEAANIPHADKTLLEDLCGRPRDFLAKKYIIRVGDELASFPILLSGWAVRYQILRDGSRQITRLLLPGDALYLESARDTVASEELITLTPCRIINIPHAEMSRMIERYPAISEVMRHYGRIENSILSSWVVNIGRRDALERMAHLFCEIQFRLALVGGMKGDQFLFPLTQDDLADVLGLTPVHINRKLQQLRQEELISLRSRQMTILNLRQLQQVAGFDCAYLAPRAGPQDSIARSLAS